MNIKSLKNRIYADYFMKNRFEEYKNILENFLENGYKFITIDEYRYIRFDNKDKIVILRHDIDSDLRIAKEMFYIERNLGIKSTYYFRLYTIDIDFMRLLDDYGNELGYHFEEIASFAKKHNLKTKEEVYKYFPIIREELEDNIKNFIDLGFNLKSICSHGDFKNRELGIRNKEILNEEILDKYNIIEAYTIEDTLDMRIADTQYLDVWVGGSLEDMINNKSRSNLILIHPRAWDSNFCTRLKLDFERLLRK